MALTSERVLAMLSIRLRKHDGAWTGFQTERCQKTSAAAWQAVAGNLSGGGSLIHLQQRPAAVCQRHGCRHLSWPSRGSNFVCALNNTR